QISATLAPVDDQLARRFAHRHRHLDRSLRGVGAWHGIVEKHHDPVARELVERPLELADQGPQRAVILAQETQHLLGLGGLGEGGVAAEITEHDDDLLTMAFKDFLVALRDYEFGKLRREEPLQAPDTAQFLDLFGNPCFEATVQFRYLVSALAQL